MDYIEKYKYTRKKYPQYFSDDFLENLAQKAKKLIDKNVRFKDDDLFTAEQLKRLDKYSRHVIIRQSDGYM
jgi:hypothetical protein